MTRFHYAHAGGPSGEAAIEACIGKLGPTLPQNGLGMLYVTDAIGDQLPAALDRLKRATGIDEWVGSVGIGICATGREYFDEPAAAVMIADLDQTSYRVFETIRDDLGEFSHDNGAWIARAPARFAIVHADPRNQRTGDIIADLADELEGFLVGGLSSSRAVPAQIAGGVTEGGVSGVLLSETVAVATALSQSCMPIGPGSRDHRLPGQRHHRTRRAPGAGRLQAGDRRGTRRRAAPGRRPHLRGPCRSRAATRAITWCATSWASTWSAG